MTIRDLPIPSDPTNDEALALFRSVEELFPSKSLGDDKWYILTVSRRLLVSSVNINCCSSLLW